MAHNQNSQTPLEKAVTRSPNATTNREIHEGGMRAWEMLQRLDTPVEEQVPA